MLDALSHGIASYLGMLPASRMPRQKVLLPQTPDALPREPKSFLGAHFVRPGTDDDRLGMLCEWISCIMLLVTLLHFIILIS